MRRALLLLIALPLGCEAPRESAQTQSREINPELTGRPWNRIEFTITECYGTCPAFTLSIGPDGKGEFDGGHFVRVRGKREFEASPEQISAFVSRLQPFRPKGSARYDYENCSVGVATDNPTIRVRWTGSQTEDSLDWYTGCDEPALVKISPNLYEAWKELPIQELVGNGYEPRGA